MNIKYAEVTINGLTKEEVLQLDTDAQLAFIETEIMAMEDDNPNKIEMMKSVIRLMDQEKVLAEIDRMQKETRDIRKSLVKNELDYEIRKGFFDELVEAGLSDEQIYKFTEVLAGWKF